MIVSLGERSYPVIINHQATDFAALLAQYITDKQVAIVTNDIVWSFHGEQLSLALANWQQPTLIVLRDGETHKSISSLTQIFDQLLADYHTRQTTLISFGGGVITDITGLAASLYQRGVNLIHIPTTLLAQVDACLGGKTGINYNGIKNNIGTFYQPKAVIIDTKWLATLPQREFQSGLAEVLKMAIAFDAEFFVWLEQNAKKIMQRDSVVLLHAIERCCELKAQIIQQDEFDLTTRALLNLGHTFAHAIESGLNYSCLHGEAVAIGLVAAAKLSVKLNRLSITDAKRIEQLLQAWQLPVSLPKTLAKNDLLAAMARDKKITEVGLHFIIPSAIGQAEKVAGIERNVIAGLF